MNDSELNEAPELVVVTCPGWCEADQEHADADDRDHWTHDRWVDQDQFSASVQSSGGCAMITVRFSDHVRMELTADVAASLVGVLAELLGLVARHTWVKQTVLLDVAEGGAR